MTNDNIFEALRRDHDAQRSLLEKLTDTSGSSDERETLFKALVTELEEHARYEEQYFYQPILNLDLTQEKARHSIAEHHQIDKLIQKLQDEDMSSPNWLKIAKDLKDKVEHHLLEEEREIFQLAGKALHSEEKTQLGLSYAANMKNARRESSISFEDLAI